MFQQDIKMPWFKGGEKKPRYPAMIEPGLKRVQSSLMAPQLKKLIKLYLEVFGKPLNIYEEVKDDDHNTKDVIVSVFQRFQTQEEVIRTRGFAR